MARMFDDSKTFVDMKLKFSPDEIIKKFNDMMQANNNAPSHDAIDQFLTANFDKPGSEFEDWEPTDWKENPKFLDNIKDESYKQWASDLNQLWHLLGRKMTTDVEVS